MLEHSKQQRLGVTEAGLHEIEEALLTIALLSIQFEMQSGYTEKAIAKLQVKPVLYAAVVGIGT